MEAPPALGGNTEVKGEGRSSRCNSWLLEQSVLSSLPESPGKQESQGQFPESQGQGGWGQSQALDKQIKGEHREAPDKAWSAGWVYNEVSGTPSTASLAGARGWNTPQGLHPPPRCCPQAAHLPGPAVGLSSRTPRPAVA